PTRPAATDTYALSLHDALPISHPHEVEAGLVLVRREHATAVGPVDLLCRDTDGCWVAVEIKRRGEIAGVEQLARYVEMLERDGRSEEHTAELQSRGHVGCRLLL